MEDFIGFMGVMDFCDIGEVLTEQRDNLINTGLDTRANIKYS